MTNDVDRLPCGYPYHSSPIPTSHPPDVIYINVPGLLHLLHFNFCVLLHSLWQIVIEKGNIHALLLSSCWNSDLQ